MILADTSVWIDHFRRGNARLGALLDAGEVAMHRFVVGELAMGRLDARRQILELLSGLPELPTVTHEEALHFVDAHRLGGFGLGWIDVHLLAAAIVARVPLWTLDRKLASAHDRLARST
ncbi:MAG: type II toxin-antitoxin system VapC family toxin [Gemmatimonadales bacterium]